MTRFLFATWEGGGHVQPMLLAARGVIAAGHQALAISDACNASDAAALGGLDARALVTLGPVLSPADFPAPANVIVTAHAPHSQVFPHAALVITHCGHASTLRPLMAGLPLVCLPLGRDQPDNAARVTERGAGVRVSAEASADDIAKAIRTVLSEPGYRAAAKALGARIAADAEARSAERELIDFATAGDIR